MALRGRRLRNLAEASGLALGAIKNVRGGTNTFWELRELISAKAVISPEMLSVQAPNPVSLLDQRRSG